MKLLALETSAKSVSVAVLENGFPLAHSEQCVGLTHSRTLMPMVEALLQNSDLTLAQMDGVAVAAGPGSFTGIRIGIAAAKGLCWAAEKPAVAVSTLEAMAQRISHMDGLLVCAMDARRGEIYHARFRAAGGVLTRLCPDCAIGLDALAEELRKNDEVKIVVGDGADLCYHHMLKNQIACTMAPPHLLMQNAIGVGMVAERLFANGETVSAQALAPVYLRISQAERERNERIGATNHD